MTADDGDRYSGPRGKLAWMVQPELQNSAGVFFNRDDSRQNGKDAEALLMREMDDTVCMHWQ